MIKDVWHPDVAFRYVKSTETIPFWGTDQNFNFWFNAENNNLDYYQAMKVTFYCDYDFNHYPFDEHECHFEFGIPSDQVNYSLNIGPVQILNSNSVPTLLNQDRSFESNHLPYDFTIIGKDEFAYYNYKYFSPFSGIIIKVRRNSLGLLVGKFYIPTSIFTMLSMLSYFIQPDIVSIQKIINFVYLVDR